MFLSKPICNKLVYPIPGFILSRNIANRNCISIPIPIGLSYPYRTVPYRTVAYQSTVPYRSVSGAIRSHQERQEPSGASGNPTAINRIAFPDPQEPFGTSPDLFGVEKSRIRPHKGRRTTSAHIYLDHRCYCYRNTVRNSCSYGVKTCKP
jgi:hypothetical protein